MQRIDDAEDSSVGRKGQSILPSSGVEKQRRKEFERGERNALKRCWPVLGAAFKENRNSELRNSGYVPWCTSDFNAKQEITFLLLSTHKSCHSSVSMVYDRPFYSFRLNSFNKKSLNFVLILNCNFSFGQDFAIFGFEVSRRLFNL